MKKTHMSNVHIHKMLTDKYLAETNTFSTEPITFKLNNSL